MDGASKTQPPPVRAANIGFEEEWLVGAVLDHRQVDVRCTEKKGVKEAGSGVQDKVVTHVKKLQYLCHWKGYDAMASTWVDQAMLHQYEELVALYWTGKKLIETALKDRKRKMGELEPEYDTENWPWVEQGGPVIDPKGAREERE